MDPFRIFSVVGFLAVVALLFPTLRGGFLRLKLVAVLALLYPIAKICQGWEIGPDFFRWWAGDVGFVPLGMAVGIGYAMRRASGEQLEPLAALDQALTTVLRIGIGVLTFAVLAEAFQLLVLNPNIDLRDLPEGTKIAWGDMFDLVAYVIGFSVAVAMVWSLRYKLSLVRGELLLAERHQKLAEIKRLETDPRYKTAANKKHRRNKSKKRRKRRKRT